MNRNSKFRLAGRWVLGGDYLAIPYDDDNVLGFGRVIPDTDPIETTEPDDYVLSEGNPWSVTDPANREFGNVDWRGGLGVLSWWGPQSRYWFHVNEFYNPLSEDPNRHFGGVQFQGSLRRDLRNTQNLNAWDNKIYSQGEILATIPDVAVLGAALAKDELGGVWIVTITANTFVSGFYPGATIHSCYAAPFTDPSNWSLVAQFAPPAPTSFNDHISRLMNTWCFSSSGIKAVSLQYIKSGPAFNNYRADKVEIELVVTSGGVTGEFVSSPSSYHDERQYFIGTQKDVRSHSQSSFQRHPTTLEYSYLVQKLTGGSKGQAGVIDFHKYQGEVLAYDYRGEKLIELRIDEVTDAAVTADIECEIESTPYTMIYSTTWDDCTAFTDTGAGNLSRSVKLVIREEDEEDIILSENLFTEIQSWLSTVNWASPPYHSMDNVTADFLGLPHSSGSIPFDDFTCVKDLSITHAGIFVDPYVTWADLRTRSVIYSQTGWKPGTADVAVSHGNVLAGRTEYQQDITLYWNDAPLSNSTAYTFFYLNGELALQYDEEGNLSFEKNAQVSRGRTITVSQSFNQTTHTDGTGLASARGNTNFDTRAVQNFLINLARPSASPPTTQFSQIARVSRLSGMSTLNAMGGNNFNNAWMIADPDDFTEDILDDDRPDTFPWDSNLRNVAAGSNYAINEQILSVTDRLPDPPVTGPVVVKVFNIHHNGQESRLNTINGFNLDESKRPFYSIIVANS